MGLRKRNVKLPLGKKIGMALEENKQAVSTEICHR